MSPASQARAAQVSPKYNAVQPIVARTCMIAAGRRVWWKARAVAANSSSTPARGSGACCSHGAGSADSSDPAPISAHPIRIIDSSVVAHSSCAWLRPALRPSQWRAPKCATLPGRYLAGWLSA
ncbi:MAG: hypothetical protein IPK27_13485 [Rhodanobacteraceae bacterium]|nr:hypothetical protein [Rhodanobacteraceae bacterium]